VVGLFGWWPLPIGSQGGYDPKARLLPRGLLLLAPNEGNNGAVEFTWRGLELIVGNYYVLTLLVFIAATVCALVLTRRLRPERAAPGLLTDLPPSSQGRGTRQRGMRFRRTTRSRRDRTVLPAWPRESPPTDGA
jgi:hypothetical protein